MAFLKKTKKIEPIINVHPSLTKFIAQAGVCSRRKATDLVNEGIVTVNGEVIREPGYRVMPGDKITVYGQLVHTASKKVYILLNKPRDYITSTADEKGRRTVMDLIQDIGCRIYPVGRLDRNTTGALLLTNDGLLAQQLSHPKKMVPKLYYVMLDKPLTAIHHDEIIKGVRLEDGLITVDSLSRGRKSIELMLEIHSGRNRVIRRLFESLGYEVKCLDRVSYAGIEKAGLAIGAWRYLVQSEIDYLVKGF